MTDSNEVTPRPTTRSRLPFWAALLGLFALVPLIGVPVLLGLFSEPLFTSVADLSPQEIAQVRAFVLNRPDGQPDVGKPRELYAVPPDHAEAVLKTLRSAKTVETLPPKIWLGRLSIKLQSGRSQTIQLYRIGENDHLGKAKFVFKVGQYQYEANTVDEFTDALDASR